MSTKSNGPDDQTWIDAELQDSFDEELEMEIDDDRIAAGIGEAGQVRTKSAIERMLAQS